MGRYMHPGILEVTCLLGCIRACDEVWTREERVGAHAYLMAKVISRHMSPGPSDRTVSLVMRRMVEKGWVSTEMDDNRRPRRTYVVTAAGHKALEGALKGIEGLKLSHRISLREVA